jgi:hypothetical protein
VNPGFWIDQFLQRYALVNQKANSTQTYVCALNGDVVGFYSLAVGGLDPEAAPAHRPGGRHRRHSLPAGSRQG